MDLAYIRQKAREALDCLTSDGSLDDRLVSSGMALTRVPEQGLPADVWRQLLITKRAFTLYPDAWRALPGWDGNIGALIGILPYMRKRRLAEMVGDLFEAICTLKPAPEDQTAEKSGDELQSPDKWEFLFWGLSHTDSPEIQDVYVRYAQNWLPNLPPAALLEWLGRHGYHGFHDWSHLDLERLSFRNLEMSFDELTQIQTVEPSFSDVGPKSYGYFHLHRDGDWIGQHIRQNDTWSVPIVVLRQPAATLISTRQIEAGLVLIEGHQRLSRLLNWPRAKSRTHQVMLGQVN